MSGINKFKAPDRDENDSPRSEKSTRSDDYKKRQTKKEQFSGDKGDTYLYCGERISKSDKMLSALGTIEELIAFLGIIKSEHYNTGIEMKFDTPSSAKLFLFASLTRIQEALLEIMRSLGTSKKVIARYEASRFRNADKYISELEKNINDMNVEIISVKSFDKPLPLIPGTTALEARLFYARALCRRAERQIHSSRNVQLGLIIEESCLTFLNRLGDYFLALAIDSLHIQSKEPLRRTGKK